MRRTPASHAPLCEGSVPADRSSGTLQPPPANPRRALPAERPIPLLWRPCKLLGSAREVRSALLALQDAPTCFAARRSPPPLRQPHAPAILLAAGSRPGGMAPFTTEVDWTDPAAFYLGDGSLADLADVAIVHRASGLRLPAHSHILAQQSRVMRDLFLSMRDQTSGHKRKADEASREGASCCEGGV